MTFYYHLAWKDKDNQAYFSVSLMMMMMMMIDCFCGMVDRQKAFSLISGRGHCQRSSPSRISDTPQAEFEPARILSSGLVEWSCAVVITTAPRRHCEFIEISKNTFFTTLLGDCRCLFLFLVLDYYSLLIYVKKAL